MSSYVLLNINKDNNFIKFDLIKVNSSLVILDKIQIEFRDNYKEEILNFINFCRNSIIILSKRKETLSIILDMLYKNKIYDRFNFKYIDIGNISFNTSMDIYNYLNINNLTNLDDLLFSEVNHGRVFRGITYPKYLCDIQTDNNKYYGYIVDFSKDKYVGYYSCLKEINGEYFNKEEINKLYEKGCIIILNVSSLCSESLTFTNYYSIVSMNDNLDNYIEYKKKNKDLRLVLWGSKSNNDIVDIVKKSWDYWNVDDVR